MGTGNEVEIPTEKEIASLPRWAQVAFAARCARRVQPLFVHDWPDAPQRHIDNIDKAITLAESSAASPDTASELLATAYADTAYADAASTASAASAASASRSSSSALSAADAYATSRSSSSSSSAAYAAASASRASSSSSAAYAAANTAIKADFEFLHLLAQREEWNNDTPVPPEIFGPMWPDGVPEGWPALSDDGEQLYLKVELAVPQGMSDEDSHEFNNRVSRFFAKISAAHVVMGGTGLRIVEDASCSPLPLLDEEPVGAGSSHDAEGWGE